MPFTKSGGEHTWHAWTGRAWRPEPTVKCRPSYHGWGVPHVVRHGYIQPATRLTGSFEDRRKARLEASTLTLARSSLNREAAAPVEAVQQALKREDERVVRDTSPTSVIPGKKDIWASIRR